MVMTRPHSTDRRWHCSVLVGLLIALTAWTSTWALRPLGSGMAVAVLDGQLSVDLQEAQVREVLAAIGRQAGLHVHVDGAANRTVNAQFTEMALDQGIRRLLRAASLSYTLLYARGPAETAILREVRVFGEAHGEAPASYDRAGIKRVQRGAALVPPLPQEEDAEPELTEAEQAVEPEPVEPKPDVDAAHD